MLLKSTALAPRQAVLSGGRLGCSATEARNTG